MDKNLEFKIFQNVNKIAEMQLFQLRTIENDEFAKESDYREMTPYSSKHKCMSHTIDCVRMCIHVPNCNRTYKHLRSMLNQK